MIYPTKEEFIRLSEDSNIVPVTREVYSDTKTPISIFMRYAQTPNSFLLESVEGGEKWARYSFIGRNPYMTFSAAGEKITITEGGETRQLSGNPMKYLKELYAGFKYAQIEGLPRFSGGAVGYFAYDAVRYIEELPDAPIDDIGAPDCYLMFCDEVIVYDHFKQKVMVIVNAHINGDPEQIFEDASKRLHAISAELEAEYTKPTADKKQEGKIEFTSNFTKPEFCEAVKKAKQYIYDGDIFQVVLSQRLTMDTDAAPFDVYRVLRTLNPSPYMYFLSLSRCGDSRFFAGASCPAGR